jgi:hypothetical protein
MLDETTYQELHRLWTQGDQYDLGFDFFVNLDIMGEFESLGISIDYKPEQSVNLFAKIIIDKMKQIDDGKHDSRFLVDRALKELRLESKIKRINGDF